MGVLDRFERGVERVVNGAFARAFKSEVQPVELASAPVMSSRTLRCLTTRCACEWEKERSMVLPRHQTKIGGWRGAQPNEARWQMPIGQVQQPR